MAMAEHNNRGNGMYLSEIKRHIGPVGGRAVHDVLRPMLPNYLLVFVWDIEQHWTRVKVCPGPRIIAHEGPLGGVEQRQSPVFASYQPKEV
jgi:hypothetical protein